MSEENKIMVSVSTLTFNHAQYIRECLDGFLIQECNFDFEVLIHDDASTDGTQEIIREYQKKYPHIIKPIFQTENQYSKGVRGMNAKYNFSRAKGKYIALCEGDDYWTDPLKLQKQVDFLDENKDVALVFHNAKVIRGENERRGLKYFNESKYFDSSEVLVSWIIPTASTVFRKSVITEKYYERLQKEYLYGDIILFLSAAEEGKLFGFSEKMSVYRRHENGILYTDEKDKFKQILLYILHYQLLSKDFNAKYASISYEIISGAYIRLFHIKRSFSYLLEYNYYLLKATKKKFFSLTNVKVNIYNVYLFFKSSPSK